MMVYLSSPTFIAFSLVVKQVGVQHHLEGGPELVRHHLKRALLTRLFYLVLQVFPTVENVRNSLEGYRGECALGVI